MSSEVSGIRKVIPIIPQAGHEPPEPHQDLDQELVSLYASDQTIYPRSVSGLFSNWRWGMVWLTQIIFYGLPWLEWGQRQAVLFDLASRRFYIFGLVLYPQDFIYLTGIPGHLGALAVPLHGGGRAPVVRLRLPADGLHRNLPLDRAKNRRRPLSAHAPRCQAAVAGQDHAQIHQAFLVAGRGLVDRLYLCRLLHADQRAWR